MPEPVDLNFVANDVWGGSILQWADRFNSTKDLVDQAIAKLKPGQCIRRLVIAAHGAERTNGFTVLDPDLTGTELIDGATKQPIAPRLANELVRLKPYLCPDAIIEFRVCRFAIGKNGDKAMQAVADLMGVAVTAPEGEISSIAAIGGIATSWKVAYPKSWGVPIRSSFWRGDPVRRPTDRDPSSIAPITGQVLPLRSVPTTPAATTTTPITKVSVVNPNPPQTNRVLVAAAGLVVGALLLGWWAFDRLNTTAPVAVASPTPAPTVSPTPTASPTPTPTLAPTPSPTPSPTPTPAPTPSPTQELALLPPDGTYVGDGMFTSFDGSESYPTFWGMTLAGDAVEIAQLLTAGGAPFQTATGIADPHGLLVAVIDDPNLCEVLLVPVDPDRLVPADFMFVAYGSAGMTCPAPQDFAQVFGDFIEDPTGMQTGIPNHYGWGDGVTVGLARIDNWTMR